MKWGKMVAFALIVLLTMGMMQIPIATAATYAFNATGWGMHGYYGSGNTLVMFTANALGIRDASTYIELNAESGYTWASSANFSTFTHSVTVDGVEVASGNFNFYLPNAGGQTTNMMFRITPVTGIHTVVWSVNAARSNLDTFTWSGTFTGDMTIVATAPDPLAISLSGPTVNVFSASVSGGVPAYSYAWSTNYGTGAYGLSELTNSTFAPSLPAGDYTITCTATDATFLNTASATISGHIDAPMGPLRTTIAGPTSVNTTTGGT